MRHILTFGILALANTTLADTNRIWTDQGWAGPNENAAIWYDISQGSQLIRAEWFDALLADGGTFENRALDKTYGFPYWDDTAPYPIGFVIDTDEAGQKWIGMNCSACHTSRLYHQDTELMVHGGQAMADFRSFLVDLGTAMRDVNADDTARSTFYSALPPSAGYASFDDFALELDAWLDHRGEVDRILDGLDEHQDWGYGRADAVAYIQAATARVVQTKPAEIVSIANAPVNYPAAWNANQQGSLQHNGLVSNGTDLSIFDENVKIGAYIRNWTEALGVFAKASMDNDGKLKTSIKGPNLLKIEKSLASLQSPQWPQDVISVLDTDMMSIGAEIYKENCVACHGIVEDVTDLSRKYPLDAKPCSVAGSTYGNNPFVCVQPVVDGSVTSNAQQLGYAPSAALTGTDPMMTCNIMLHQIPTGKLEGKLKKNTFTSFDGLGRFSDVEFTNQVMAALIIKDLWNQSGDLIKSQLESETRILIDTIRTWFGIDGQKSGDLYSLPKDEFDDRFLALCADMSIMLNSIDPESFPLPGYKARPLNGIWATAPYLHNGSVPTLYDLLTKPADRPTTFLVPQGHFDPVKVGLAQDAGGFEFNVVSPDGANIVGNSNAGHDYGTSLSETDKRALIEYLKSL